MKKEMQTLFFFCQSYRDWRYGDKIEWPEKDVGEDQLNFYLYGWEDEYPSGITSNYLVLPRYSVARYQLTAEVKCLISS